MKADVIKSVSPALTHCLVWAGSSIFSEWIKQIERQLLHTPLLHSYLHLYWYSLLFFNFVPSLPFLIRRLLVPLKLRVFHTCRKALQSTACSLCFLFSLSGYVCLKSQPTHKEGRGRVPNTTFPLLPYRPSQTTSESLPKMSRILPSYSPLNPVQYGFWSPLLHWISVMAY